MTTTTEDSAGDRLAVTGIEAFGRHGVLDFERRDGQAFVVDLVLVLDTRPAARSDDLHDTVDYGSLVGKVRHGIENDPVDLIETLAQRLADICLEDPRVRRAEVTVHKPHAPIQGTFGDVTLTISRSRSTPSAPPPPHEPPDPNRSRP
jgi:dihydroneopterin aldolase